MNSTSIAEHLTFELNLDTNLGLSATIDQVMYLYPHELVHVDEQPSPIQPSDGRHQIHYCRH